MQRWHSRRPEDEAICTSVGHDTPEVYYNVSPRVDSMRAERLAEMAHYPGSDPRVGINRDKAGLLGIPTVVIGSVSSLADSPGLRRTRGPT